MGKTTNIQWADATWNISRGCTKVDADCLYCYMYREANRYKFDAKTVTRTKTVFDMPLKYKNNGSARWGGPPLIFVNSLSDFFHEGVDPFRDEAWDIIRRRPDLIFIIPTKRPERIAANLPADWGVNGWDNVWLGTSVGSINGIARVRKLAAGDFGAFVRFASLEPLTEDIVPNAEFRAFASYLDWIIAGGESGNDAGAFRFRPAQETWFTKLARFAEEKNIPFFMKQLGTYIAKAKGLRDREGGNIEEFPPQLRVREFPHREYYERKQMEYSKKQSEALCQK